ncbi:trimeric intracellular cation channel family protein [Solitalea koreensis]|uniref:Uncharacterized membrane protein YeiH n=1 Tax=Solitalea koreensis TaxID=543615 RepID=A0A521CXZ5_9SPHI|nr:TRIC cation channel family protein [Solitalea koreensis]SMO64336.1 Uncharacterized membrane protein YeiH [Solitalea koreensis]
MEEVTIQGQYHLPIWFDLFATFLFAFVGSVKAVEKGYDFIGVYVLAFVTSVGGGLIRDVLLQHGPPVVLQDYRYLLTVLISGTVGIFFYTQVHRLQRTITLVDSLSLGIYAVYGTQKTIYLGLSPVTALIIGFINAVGGGLIRDVLTKDEIKLFKPGRFYSVASLLAIVTFLIIGGFLHFHAKTAAIISITCSFALRFLAVKYNWRTIAIKRAFKNNWFRKES